MWLRFCHCFWPSSLQALRLFLLFADQARILIPGLIWSLASLQTRVEPAPCLGQARPRFSQTSPQTRRRWTKCLNPRPFHQGRNNAISARRSLASDAWIHVMIHERECKQLYQSIMVSFHNILCSIMHLAESSYCCLQETTEVSS